ncbi:MULTISPECIES: accessory Sec system S-layer assembly protein [Bacillus]|uniref:accessory Sec system S-layer assembly protein n=1 Tax=Bacillus TaxID=1386 RepID=UPI000DC21C68|nr:MULTISPECIES: accessory Sec system S-layer assembly protein [Bacillus]MDM5426323.1 accessory Sec system S-layer assembly protein [Bacillus mycoides]RAN85404.1 accessory Sec system S-layer assembly protein [Bacillus sp. SRB_331]
MLSFLKKAKKKGKDTTVSSNQLFGQEETTSQNKTVKPVLYFHPSWGNVAQEQKYIYQFLHKELPRLQEYQISLSGIEIEKRDGAYDVAAFIRSSVPKPISFEEVTLLLLNKDKKLCARKTFNLSALGDIPENVNMPFVFTFEQETITEAELSQSDWELAFELESKHQLDLDPSWESQLPEASKDALRNFVDNLTPPNEGEINFLGLQAALKENGDLHTTLLIRNGCKDNIQLEQLPLHIEDASGEVVVKGAFTLPNLEIKANTTKPWSFVFPASSILKQNMDLSSWKAFVPQD